RGHPPSPPSFPYTTLFRFFSTRMRINSRKQQEATGRLNAMLHENVQGNRVVKVFGQEAFEAERLRDQDERIFTLFMRASRIRSRSEEHPPQLHALTNLVSPA